MQTLSDQLKTSGSQCLAVSNGCESVLWARTHDHELVRMVQSLQVIWKFHFQLFWPEIILNLHLAQNWTCLYGWHLSNEFRSMWPQIFLHVRRDIHWCLFWACNELQSRQPYHNPNPESASWIERPKYTEWRQSYDVKLTWYPVAFSILIDLSRQLCSTSNRCTPLKEIFWKSLANLRVISYTYNIPYLHCVSFEVVSAQKVNKQLTHN